MDYYRYNRRIMKACGLTGLPDRRTFDRRLSTISAEIKERITTNMLCGSCLGYDDHKLYKFSGPVNLAIKL